MKSADASALSSSTWDSALFLISFALTGWPLAGAAVRLARWVSPWLARPKRDPSRTGDLWLLGILTAWALRLEIWIALCDPFTARSVTSMIGLAAFFGGTYVVLNFRARMQHQSWASAILKHDALSSPWIVPSRTSHTRLFPKKHAFSYSYLTVAVPVGFVGWCWPLLSVDVKYAKGWLHVQGSDHLARDSPGLDLQAKLSRYLRSQHVGDDEWSHAYLVTAPRFLGYSFNPVSFWYVYDEEKILKKMILEVNNTFGERRMYLLDAEPQTLTDNERDELSRGDRSFKKTWAKDFHVSPFNSRKGSYSFTASDPFSHSGCVPGQIDNTVVMKSSKDHAKIVARLVSTGAPINPRELTYLGIVVFVARWWWVGFMTFPRIVKEAAKLFFQHKLHVWFRPEVVNTSISRTPTAVESSLSVFIDRYLNYTIRKSQPPVLVEYETSAGTKTTISATASRDPGPYDVVGKPAARELRIKITTPAFYSRLVHYAHITEALDREVLFTDEKNQTLWSSDPSLLTQLFSDRQRKSQREPELGWVSPLRWEIHRRLRCAPPEQAYPAAQKSPTHDVVDIRVRTLSPLDHFVREHCDDSLIYLRCCGRLFLAERCALGFVALVDLADLLVRAAMCYWLTVPAILHPVGLPVSAGILDSRLVRVIGEMLGLWALHIWSQIKGT